MLYSTFDRELFAAFSAIKHFGFFLEGRPFTLFIDLKPLVSAISKSKTPFSSRQQRQLAFLSDLPGQHNVVAVTITVISAISHHITCHIPISSHCLTCRFH